jgi:hypothetical protein
MTWLTLEDIIQIVKGKTTREKNKTHGTLAKEEGTKYQDTTS